MYYVCLDSPWQFFRASAYNNHQVLDMWLSSREAIGALQNAFGGDVYLSGRWLPVYLSVSTQKWGAGMNLMRWDEKPPEDTKVVFFWVRYGKIWHSSNA